ncbi:SPOR domain-containing protein [Sphingomonas sp.]|uniref:SPOR domain-containing protein n=1 Tax=Sphingomonas sp. TaxID=28214 RepID=UPI003B3BA75C
MKRVVLALLVLAAAADGAIVPELRMVQAKAEAGDANAQFALAEAYRSGRGVTADPDTAITWYRKAAERGHIRASEELGFALFARGDRKEAMPYIEKAAARGDARALYVLGTAHFNGDYTSRDWPLAYAQTMRAASAGLPAAQKNLDLMDQYLLPSDRAKADEILATLPPIRTIAQREALNAASSATRIAGGSGPVAVPAKTLKPTVSTGAPATALSTASGAPPQRGAWKAQLGAYGSSDRAKESWTRLSAKVPQLATYEQRVVAANAVQRLQAWGISGRSDADRLCTQVRSAGGQCFVVAP